MPIIASDRYSGHGFPIGTEVTKTEGPSWSRFPDDWYMDDMENIAAVDPRDLEEDDPTPCCPDPGCPGRFGTLPCEFPGYADNH